jgi:hypothetical protein
MEPPLTSFVNVPLIVAVLIMCVGCQKPPTPKAVADGPAFRKPTATEVFNLTSKCAELGKTINDEYDFASSGNVTFKMPFIKQEQFSHYDPKTNRCYVELRVSVNSELLAFIMVVSKQSPKRSKMKDGLDDFLKHYDLAYSERHLYDAQTGAEVASLQNGLIGVEPTGVIVGRSTKVGWIDALEEINKLMGR